VFVNGPENPILSVFVPETLRDTAEPGEVFEFCPAAIALGAVIGARLKYDRGAALFIDYGNVASRPETSLGALAHHQPVDMLASPGNADLSAHVDFAAFAHAARGTGANTHGPVPQGRFLGGLGASARLAALSERATSGQRQRLESGVERLLDPAQMGDLFKALALVSPWLPTPFGFDFAETQR